MGWGRMATEGGLVGHFKGFDFYQCGLDAFGEF